MVAPAGTIAPVLPPFRDVRPGGPLSAAELNRAMDEVERLARLTVAPPLELVRDASGLHLRLGGFVSFWAELTAGPTSSAYAWSEVAPDPATPGDWVTLDAGRSGTVTRNAAYELNGQTVSLTVDDDPTRVQLWTTPFDWFVFAAPEGTVTPAWTPPRVLTGWDCTDGVVTLTFKYVCRDGSLVDDPGDCP
jgi:hypothetical protein